MRRAQQIEDYLLGNMSEEDRENFEFEMNQDESLSDMVLAQRKILGVLQDKKTIAFKEKLDGIRERRNSEIKNATSVFQSNEYWLLPLQCF